MPIRMERRGRFAFLSIRGDLDAATSPLLKRALLQEIGSGARDVVVDMSGVRFADSTALAALAEAERWLSERSGRLTVEEPSKAVRDVLLLTGAGNWLGFGGVFAGGEAVREGA